MVDMLTGHLLHLHVLLKVVLAHSTLVHLGIKVLISAFNGRKGLNGGFRGWWGPITIWIILSKLLNKLLQTRPDEVVAKISLEPSLRRTILDYHMNLCPRG